MITHSNLLENRIESQSDIEDVTEKFFANYEKTNFTIRIPYKKDFKKFYKSNLLHKQKIKFEKAGNLD
jgi:hypothetical protein